MRSKLNTAAKLIGRHDFDCKNLTYQILEATAALRDAGRAASTINSTLCALKGVARAAWLIGLLSPDDYQKIQDLRGVKGSRLPRGRAHTPQELTAILKVCQSDPTPAGRRDAAIIAIAHSAGLRRDECVRLEVSDYSPVTNCLRVRGKGDKERTGYVKSPGAQAAVASWLNTRGLAAGPLLCPIKRSGKIIFRRMTGEALYNAISKRARAAGIVDTSPHNFRRTFATNLFDAGADIGIVQKLLGHASITTTEIYDRREEKTKSDAAGLIDFPFEDREPDQLELFCNAD